MRLRYLSLIVLACIIITGCGKSSDNNSQPVAVDPTPAKANLIFPAQNALCTSGTVISTTQTSIVFNWAAAVNADSYAVNFKNLLTGAVSMQITATNQLTVVLSRNTPYSWYVVSQSKNSIVTSTSDTWRFYVAGLGVTYYSPFPATITSPVFGQIFATGTSTVKLAWLGSDVDGDISGFDIYFGTAATPPLFKSNISDIFLNSVPVSAGATYYWKIITKDTLGNTSDSGVYQFYVN